MSSACWTNLFPTARLLQSRASQRFFERTEICDLISGKTRLAKKANSAPSGIRFERKSTIKPASNAFGVGR
jgi:hypothetical protein